MKYLFFASSFVLNALFMFGIFNQSIDWGIMSTAVGCLILGNITDN
jgi:hypothetical protein